MEIINFENFQLGKIAVMTTDDMAHATKRFVAADGRLFVKVNQFQNIRPAQGVGTAMRP